MARRALFGFILLAAFGAAAQAAPRTMISDYTGLDCATNTAGFVYEQPNLKSATVTKLDNDVTVHILGGKQFGPFVAIPGTDEEFARTWLHIKFGKTSAWIQSGAINCGG